MAYEGSESAQDNFGKFINQLKPNIKIFVWKFERILIKLYWLNASLLFNQIYIYVCVCVWYKTNKVVALFKLYSI